MANMPQGNFIQGVDLARLRTEYQQRSLSEQDVDPDPIRQFQLWLSEAIGAQAHEPNAMTLATCTRDGVPSARTVLLKGIDEAGFVFATNYRSPKGVELEANPRAALVFFWPTLERQVRVEGEVQKTSAEESDAIFHVRPPGSQVGAAASPQSQPVASRQALEEQFEMIRKRYPDGNVPRPPHWGGYRLRPRRIEFWQGRPNRLHDRIDYQRDGASNWTIRRLAP
jgi:pyridoxamine 5'-phosphate oxidase